MNRIFCMMLASAAATTMHAQPQLTNDNIDEVLAAMTLEEKATICVGGGWGDAMAGSMTASSNVLVQGAAGVTRGIERFGIPNTVLADGPAGLRISPTRDGDSHTYYCTAFPVGTLLSCTWDTPLVESLTADMGEEVHEYGVDVLLAPGVNLHRNPLCGRNFEYYSEDPVLSGKMAAAYVRGVQSQGVGVSVKHYMGNNQETNRTRTDARIPEEALHELYLRNFEIAVREGKPWTVMSSYNKVNGTYTQQSEYLLTDILRDEWGYEGIVMTDWGSKVGTAKAAHAGNDLMEPGMEFEIQWLIDAVKSGELPESELDRNVRRILEYIVKTPSFKKYAFSNAPQLKAHAEDVRKGASEGMVLLENNGTLPLEASGKVALFGLNAYRTIVGGTGSGNVNRAYTVNVDEGLVNAGFTVDQDLADLYRNYRNYIMSEDKLSPIIPTTGLAGIANLGEGVVPEVAIRKSVIEKTAGIDDIAMVVLGRNAGEGADRTVDDDFNLTEAETALLKDVCDVYHGAGKKVIVILNVGGVIETASWKSLPDAILLAWTPGQEAGNSIADVLTGKANPSGKLAMTFPNQYFDIPGAEDFPYCEIKRPEPMRADKADLLVAMGKPVPEADPVKNLDYTDYNENLAVGYRYYNAVGKAVSYPFGYGLSYTTFGYSKPKAKVQKDGTIAFTITVTNTGKVAGKETVQVYMRQGTSVPELKAFAKTGLLEPGQSQTLTMSVDRRYLETWGSEGWTQPNGSYEVLFGASSRDIRSLAKIKI